jgi:hypothetical protein
MATLKASLINIVRKSYRKINVALYTTALAQMPLLYESKIIQVDTSIEEKTGNSRVDVDVGTDRQVAAPATEALLYKHTVKPSYDVSVKIQQIKMIEEVKS